MCKLSIVVPCYNEEEVFQDSCNQLSNLLNELINKDLISNDSFILFVNDGSKDHTWNLIDNEFNRNPYVYGLNLSGNVGHQNALFAGLMQVKDICDISISIDADLQDDITVIEEMILEYKKGNDIVYGVRNERKTDTFFKRFTAQSFYKLMNLMGVKTVYNHADFRLMSSRAIDALSKFEERNMFLRGMVPLIGFNSTSVYYARKERQAGESKYPLKKMLSFAFDGITSFSVKPITLICVLGVIVIICCVIAMIYSLIRYINGAVVSGWTSLFISIWFLGGVQLLSIGLIGEYVGKTYIEVKRRPRFNIEEFKTHEK